MAKFKKARKASRGGADRVKLDPAAQAERMARTLGQSAQQIWLAGMGAFGRAQSEGTKLFEALVKEGLNFEKGARRFAGGRADVMRGVVEQRVGQARERATDTWDRLEKVFEDRVQRALVQLGVPGRDDLNALTARVESLTSELRKRNAVAAPATRAKPAKPAKQAAPRKAAKTSASKAASKPAKKTTPRKSTATRKPAVVAAPVPAKPAPAKRTRKQSS